MPDPGAAVGAAVEELYMSNKMTRNTGKKKNKKKREIRRQD